MVTEVEWLRKKIQNKIFEICYILESVIAVIVGVAVVILCVKLFKDMLYDSLNGNGEEILVGVLDSAMTLAIGVEFIKMLCKHTPQTVVEVLLFAIAKQLVVFHTTPLENLLNVAAIAGLFAIRKFLLRREDKPYGTFIKRTSSNEADTKGIVGSARKTENNN